MPYAPPRRSHQPDPDRPITWTDPDALQRALDDLGDAPADDREEAFYRRRLTRRLERLRAAEHERAERAKATDAMSPAELAQFVGRR